MICHPERRPNERSERGQAKDLLLEMQCNEGVKKQVLRSRSLALAPSVALPQDDIS